MNRLVARFLMLLGALLLTVPWSAIRGEAPPFSSATTDECDAARPESIACGTYYFEVAGKVVYAAPGGALVPIRGAKFFEVESPARAVDAEPRDLKAKTARSGKFRFQAFVSTSSRSKSCPDGQVQTRDSYLPTFLLLRAKGCNDLTIKVEKDWSPGTIVMQCRGQ